TRFRVERSNEVFSAARGRSLTNGIATHLQSHNHWQVNGQKQEPKGQIRQVPAVFRHGHAAQIN
ncbi:MAG: hypothetical protein ACPIB0_08630, partial [Akkermansiaceae bacterium]